MQLWKFALLSFPPLSLAAVDHELRDTLLPQPFLEKRQSCPTGYSACVGASNACCPSGTICTHDQAGNVACCPSGAVCTGVIGGTNTGIVTTTTSSSGFVLGSSSTIVTATTTSFQTPSTITPGPGPGGSTIPNAFYPFVYIPTSYANAAACTSAWSYCQSESTACFQSLAGVNGVTIGGFGSGFTQAGATGTILSSASSICSSLSKQGCYGLSSSLCTAFGTNGVTSGTGTGPVTVTVTAAARHSACPGMAYIAGAGVMVGAVGAVI